MAEELGKFIPLVGGPAHGHVLLQPLEALSMVEETVVRDKAVESINLVAAELPEASIAEHLIPLVQVSAATYSVGVCCCGRLSLRTWQADCPRHATGRVLRID